MDRTLNFLACLLALLGAFVVVANWGWFIASCLNKLRGVDRHYSVVPLIAQLLFIVADGVSSWASPRVLSSKVLLMAGLSDVSLYLLMSLPFLLFRHRADPKRSNCDSD